MLINKLNRVLFSDDSDSFKTPNHFWLGASLLFAFLYSSISLYQAFDGLYVVRDDARQHVFWMRRFLDPELFPDDLIADYFQSIAPLGYKTIYAIPAFFQIDPLVISKILPAILMAIAVYYTFVLSTELLPIPFTGFISALLITQNIWKQDSLVSGTPKAFAIPLLTAFLYYFIKKSILGTNISLILCGLFYPSLVFICSGLLLIHFFPFKFRLIDFEPKQDNILCISGLVTAFLVLLPYAITSSQYAPTITAEAARSLPDFGIDGRSSFFNDREPWDFWFNGSRSGIRITSALIPALAYVGILLPFIVSFRKLFPLTKKISAKINVLPQLVIVSLVMFFTAHLLLFRLHLPSRYTENPLRIAVILSAAISITIILQYLLDQAIVFYSRNTLIANIVAIVPITLIVLSLCFYPYSIKRLNSAKYQQGDAIALYEFLQQQPKDIVVASLVPEADNLPTFAQRSILVSSEYAIPYHTGYYFPFRQRVIDLINAQYDSNLLALKRFIRQYRISFFLLESGIFTPEYIQNNSWIWQHQPAAQNAVDHLNQGNAPALKAYEAKCSVLKTDRYNLMATKCILN